MVFLQNQCINIVYPNGNNPILFICHEKKLDFYHEWILFRFKDELLFPAKQKVQMVSLQKQRLNIMYPNGNDLFLLVRCKKKLDSCQERNSPHFKDEPWMPTKRSVQMVSSWNQHINNLYPNRNNPFLLVCREKKLDSYRERSSSHFKDKLWFPTKWRV